MSNEKKYLKIRTYAVVTTDNEPLIVSYNGLEFLRKHGVKLARCYDTMYGTQIGTGISTWNGTDHGIDKKYVANARDNRSTYDCIEAISEQCTLDGIEADEN